MSDSAPIKNYEFKHDDSAKVVSLHMMDRAEKYILRICDEDSTSFQNIHIQAPEGVPEEIIQKVGESLRNNFQSPYKPKEALIGVIGVNLQDPYCIDFKIADLWYEQRLDDVKNTITQLMGLKKEYVNLDWAKDSLEKDS